MQYTAAFSMLIIFLSLVGASLYALNEFKSADEYVREQDEELHSRMRKLENKISAEREVWSKQIERLEKRLNESSAIAPPVAVVVSEAAEPRRRRLPTPRRVPGSFGCGHE